MKRRYLILAVFFVAFVGIVLGVLAMLPPRPGVTKANFDRIEKGTTLEEVDVLLGRNGHKMEIAGTAWICWQNDDGPEVCATVENNRVFHMIWYPNKETILDKIRRWLHLD